MENVQLRSMTLGVDVFTVAWLVMLRTSSERGAGTFVHQSAQLLSGIGIKVQVTEQRV
jgi:hypothetical protein